MSLVVRAEELQVLPDGSVLTADTAEVRRWRGPRVVWKASHPGFGEFAVTPDGQTLAVTWDTETVALYDLASGKLRWKAQTERPRAQEAARYDLALSPNGRWLVTSSPTDPMLRLWDGGQAVLKVPAETIVAWTSDNRLLRRDGATAFLTAGPDWGKARGLVQDSPILSWSLREGEVVTLSSTGDGPEVRAWFWDLATGKLARSLAVEAPADGLEVSSDGTRLLVWDQSSMKYQLWDVPNEKLVMSGMGRPTFAGPTVIVNQPQSVRAVRASDGTETARIMHDGPRTPSPDGAFLATHELGPGPVTLWDLTTGQKLGSIPNARKVAFSRDGSQVFVLLPGHQLRAYDPRKL